MFCLICGGYLILFTGFLLVLHSANHFEFVHKIERNCLKAAFTDDFSLSKICFDGWGGHQIK